MCSFDSQILRCAKYKFKFSKSEILHTLSFRKGNTPDTAQVILAKGQSFQRAMGTSKTLSSGAIKSLQLYYRGICNSARDPPGSSLSWLKQIVNFFWWLTS